MPTRLLAFDDLWASGKIARCAAWAQAEYSWLYGLADAFGSFELTDLSVIHGIVAPLRKNFPVDRLGEVLCEFNKHGLLFVWEQDGKIFGHWTGRQKNGHRPSPATQARSKPFAPEGPEEQLAAYIESTKVAVG